MVFNNRNQIFPYCPIFFNKPEFLGFRIIMSQKNGKQKKKSTFFVKVCINVFDLLS